MKLITLNIWGGKITEPLLAFIKSHAADNDIFVFQEVFFGTRPVEGILGKSSDDVGGIRENIFYELGNILENFNAISRVAPVGHKFEDTILPSDVHGGQAIFINKKYPVIEQGGFACYPPEELQNFLSLAMTGSFQYVVIQTSKSDNLLVGNLHGLWTKGTKGDVPERVRQCEIIAAFLAKRTEQKIIAGDFNILPDTKSMEILERGMRNLGKEKGVANTRTEYYKKEHRQHVSDYILVSDTLSVQNFEVLPDEVSDHAALALNFN